MKKLKQTPKNFLLMLNKMIHIVILLSIFTAFACEKNNETSATELLIGCWINPQITDTCITFDKASQLKDKDYGFAFKPDGVFIERKNSGWCGTPPISYKDYTGTWIKNNSLINITVGYWGGSAEYQWKIIDVDANKLIIYNAYTEYHPNDK